MLAVKILYSRPLCFCFLKPKNTELQTKNTLDFCNMFVMDWSEQSVKVVGRTLLSLSTVWFINLPACYFLPGGIVLGLRNFTFCPNLKNIWMWEIFVPHQFTMLDLLNVCSRLLKLTMQHFVTKRLRLRTL
jgi:hypothetical protein